MNFNEILSASVTLFAIIDVLGSVPYILLLKEREGKLQEKKTTIVVTFLLFVFLFVGEHILNIFGISIHAFALAGAVIIFGSSLELIFGISLYKAEPSEKGVSAVVPLAFPMLAGAGAFTSLVSMSNFYGILNIVIAILLNSLFIYLVLSSTDFLQRKISPQGFVILRKSFGMIVLAISIQMIYTHILHVADLSH